MQYIITTERCSLIGSRRGVVTILDYKDYMVRRVYDSLTVMIA